MGRRTASLNQGPVGPLTFFYTKKNLVLAKLLFYFIFALLIDTQPYNCSLPYHPRNKHDVLQPVHSTIRRSDRTRFKYARGEGWLSCTGLGYCFNSFCRVERIFNNSISFFLGLTLFVKMVSLLIGPLWIFFLWKLI